MKKISLIAVVLFSLLWTACGNSNITSEKVSEAFTPEQFDQLVKESKILIVDFKADWCGPCKVLGPILEKVAEENKGKVKLQKIDVDLSPELSKQMGITGIPYVAKYVNGQKVDELMGLAPEETIRAFFEK